VGRRTIPKYPQASQEGELIGGINHKASASTLLAKVLKLTLSNSIFLALNGTLVFVFASLLYEIPVSLTLAIAAFLITYSVYSLNMATDTKEDTINQTTAAPNKTLFYLVPSIICLILSIAIGAFSGFMVLLILLAPLIIGVSYSVKINKSVPRLKEVLGVKSIIVALSWAITGALLPGTMQSVAVFKEIMVFFYIFIQILVNTIIFDALDTRGDRESGILTIPLALGLKNTKKLLLGFNGILVIWFICCLITGVFTEYLLTLGIGIVYEVLLIWYFFKAARPRLQAAIIVDGEWLPLVLLLKMLILR
jgi:4-hydroxybenzoate polyprenyltransferase